MFDWLKRHREDEGGSAGHGGGSGSRWLVSYADFVTLMFGFFLILWASSSQDPVRLSELSVAFQRAFNTGAMIGQAGTGQIVGRGGRMGQVEISPFQRVSETAGELVAQMGLSDEISVGMKKEGIVITLSSSLLFDSGKAVLREQAVDVLARIATLIEPTTGDIRIEGHTDNIPYSTKEYPSNWELSTARAASVLRFFSEQVGMPAERFQIAGYAEFRPLVPNDSRENRNKNRRVEIILMAPQTATGLPGGAAGSVPPPTAKPGEAPKIAPEAPKAADVTKPAVGAIPAKPAEPAPAVKH